MIVRGKNYSRETIFSTFSLYKSQLVPRLLAIDNTCNMMYLAILLLLSVSLSVDAKRGRIQFVRHFQTSVLLFKKKGKNK